MVLIHLPWFWVVMVCVQEPQPVSASFQFLGSCAAPWTPQSITATSAVFWTMRSACEMLGGGRKLLFELGRLARITLSKCSGALLSGLRVDEMRWIAWAASAENWLDVLVTKTCFLV